MVSENGCVTISLCFRLTSQDDTPFIMREVSCTNIEEILDLLHEGRGRRGGGWWVVLPYFV